MAPSQATIGWRRTRKEENKIIVSFRSYLTHNRKLKKKKKKFKKLNNTVMAPFRAKIGVKMPRKKENNYCRSVSFLLNAK